MSGVGMTKAAQKRTGIVGFFCTLALSSAIMLWMSWHFPISTAIVTIVVLSAFAVSARLARSIDTDSLAELEHGSQRA